MARSGAPCERDFSGLEMRRDPENGMASMTLVWGGGSGGGDGTTTNNTAEVVELTMPGPGGSVDSLCRMDAC